MKNSKNKIMAAAVCGVIIGSVGTSIIGNFQANSVASNNNSNVQYPYKSDLDWYFGESNSTIDSYVKGYGERPKKGKHHQGEASLDSTESIDVERGQYPDGTYQGTASGYASGLKVQVTISNGQISNIEVVSHNETPGFCERAIETIPSRIISSQSTNVDTVSGATYTSVGIINAVNSALSNSATS